MAAKSVILGACTVLCDRYPVRRTIRVRCYAYALYICCTICRQDNDMYIRSTSIELLDEDLCRAPMVNCVSW